jgi:hypothetical protein
MRLVRVSAATAIAVAALAISVGTPADAQSAPTATLASEQKLRLFTNQGIARVSDGWILSANNTLARVDDKFRPKTVKQLAIPTPWRIKGYGHIGDIDVVGNTIYAPFEQSDFELGQQVTARYDLKKLRFIDAVVLPQHENSFVTIDPATMTAYSFDRFGGDAFLRYDVRAGWKPLPPLPMSRFVDKVQGADISGGAIWLSTSDPTNELFRVDLETGAVDDLGSAGHVGGEGEGIDATRLRSGRLHTLTIDPAGVPVWLGHFAVSG